MAEERNGCNAKPEQARKYSIARHIAPAFYGGLSNLPHSQPHLKELQLNETHTVSHSKTTFKNDEIECS